MKRALISIPILAMAFLAASCSKTPLFESSVTNVSASYFSADIHLNSNVENWDGDYKLGIELWSNSWYNDHEREKHYCSSKSSGVIHLSELSPAATYNYKVFIEADNVYYGESGSFKTKSLDKVSFGTTTVVFCTADMAVIRSLITIPASYSETNIVAGVFYSEIAGELDSPHGYQYNGTSDDVSYFSINNCESITIPHFHESFIEATLNRRDIVDHNGEGATYYFRPFVLLPAILDTNWEMALQMGDIQSVSLPGLPDVNGLKYVDLGLESGILWAICDVGSSAPDEQGGEFEWAGKNPSTQFNAVSAPYWSSSKVGVEWVTHLYKYNFQSKYGNCDNISTLEEKDDAATVHYGAPWRMPTAKEFSELISSCHFYLSGDRYKVTGPNGNYIYLFRSHEPNWPSYQETGGYWSSSLYTSNSEKAYCLYLPYKQGNAKVITQLRGYPARIRPVISRDQIQQ